MVHMSWCPLESNVAAIRSDLHIGLAPEHSIESSTFSSPEGVHKQLTHADFVQTKWMGVR